MKDTCKILIFIVTYNHEELLPQVLSRIPESIWKDKDIHILIIDDGSKDLTFEKAREYQKRFNISPERLLIYHNPDNQGYGGNQKLGYYFAIKNGYDIVVLLHGDGQYAPELLNEFIQPLQTGKYDAVFGSRMISKGSSLKGGMPLYKYFGNRILTKIQNALLATNLSEFHSGYRAYNLKALNDIPFQYNSNDYHFDTEIIIQLIGTGKRIIEIPIPTYYGEEICHVNGIKYAYNVIKQTIIYRLSKFEILYDRKYDFQVDEVPYQLRDYPHEVHCITGDWISSKSKVLELGASTGYFSKFLKKRGCKIVAADYLQQAHDPAKWDTYYQVDFNDIDATSKFFDEINFPSFDLILLMDVIEHLHDLDTFLDLLYKKMTSNQQLILSTANIAFFLTRLSLLFGRFNYGKRGILDLTHHRLHTFNSLKYCLNSHDFIMIEKRGSIPPIFHWDKISNPFAKLLVRISGFFYCWLVKIWPRLFAYQFVIKCRKQKGLQEIFSNLKY